MFGFSQRTELRWTTGVLIRGRADRLGPTCMLHHGGVSLGASTWFNVLDLTCCVTTSGYCMDKIGACVKGVLSGFQDGRYGPIE